MTSNDVPVFITILLCLVIFSVAIRFIVIRNRQQVARYRSCTTGSAFSYTRRATDPDLPPAYTRNPVVYPAVLDQNNDHIAPPSYPRHSPAAVS
ncbi:hypothetical protein M378DRAFT_554374 [Amanita muscaria Koide BX008]|uniref:Uncharacterized protein n=1 Tax=Amanita muscaria (strain Koide BX008) TaxID=946122 RepID=A0A0C2SP23_AMAMK|nr:hypothetical protein M378DRAFT_554374 [Amanita muscaria Koide BX008]